MTVNICTEASVSGDIIVSMVICKTVKKGTALGVKDSRPIRLTEAVIIMKPARI